mgnify:CR=1 FL=1
MAAQQTLITTGALPQTVVGTRTLLDWDPQQYAPEHQPNVLLVDSAATSRRIIRAMLREESCRFLEASRPSEALAILEGENVDLIVIDMILPEMSGIELCGKLKSDRRTQLIPVLMLTNVPGVEHEIKCINSGADDFLTKPLHPKLVRSRIRAMLRNKASLDTLDEAETILFALAQAVEARDRYTSGHCQRLAAYSVAMGKALGLELSALVALHRGGYLHDIGKVGVPDAILFKKGPLTDAEWAVMRAHTIIGEEICRPMKTLAPVLPIIRNHHERWNGSGYPDRLKGEEIPLLARILQVPDIYDALTTARPYKGALTSAEALAVMEDEARKGWRDPELLMIFRDICLSGVPVPEPSPISASMENLWRWIQSGDDAVGTG